MSMATVLIADQNADFFHAASRFISALPGYAVVNQFVGPNSLIATYKKHHPDIVLMDFAFCSSFAKLDLVGQLKQLANAPRIILVAPVNDPAYSEHSLRLGADGCIIRDRLETALPILMNELCSRYLSSFSQYVRA